MLRVPVEQIQAGMVLARPIASVDRPHRPLLPRNAEIPADAVLHLRNLGIREVWIRSRNLDFLEQSLDGELEERRRQLFGRVRENFESMLRHAEFELDLEDFRSSIVGLFEYLRERPIGGLLLDSLYSFDDYLMSHSTNVGYLSLLAGIRLADYIRSEPGRPESETPTEQPSRDMFNLGLGALLHDVGKMRIAPEILHKPGPLKGEEFAEMKRHTVLGRDMLEGHADPEAVEIPLHHHQRWDGAGYPDQYDAATAERKRALAGREIPVFCRITSMADVYDAATSRRRYSPAKTAVQVLHEMRTSCRGAFDPAVARAFFEIVPPFPVGSMVELSDGRTAVVVDLNPAAPVRPKVLCLDDRSARPRPDGPVSEEIDLAQAEEFEIVAVGGVSVRQFTASQESLPELADAAP
jgi:HD-GYP domain-containing protein (c-di-GMP phosphodiesterase class II)